MAKCTGVQGRIETLAMALDRPRKIFRFQCTKCNEETLHQDIFCLTCKTPMERKPSRRPVDRMRWQNIRKEHKAARINHYRAKAAVSREQAEKVSTPFFKACAGDITQSPAERVCSSAPQQNQSDDADNGKEILNL